MCSCNFFFIQYITLPNSFSQTISTCPQILAAHSPQNSPKHHSSWFLTQCIHRHFTFWKTQTRTDSLNCGIELGSWKPVKINPPASMGEGKQKWKVSIFTFSVSPFPDVRNLIWKWSLLYSVIQKQVFFLSHFQSREMYWKYSLRKPSARLHKNLLEIIVLRHTARLLSIVMQVVHKSTSQGSK